MNHRIKQIIVALTVVGVGISGYLSWVKWTDTEAVCGGLGDCSSVQNSAYAYIAGVPVAYLGLLLYIVLLVVAVANLLSKPGEREWLDLAVFAIAFAGAAFSAYLTFTEVAIIEAICPWCVASFVNLIVITFLAALPVFYLPADVEV